MRRGDQGIFGISIEPGQSRQSHGDNIWGSEQTPGDRWKLPITSRATHVISKTLIKTKDANCTRLFCLCCGSVMASKLPWARSLLLHRGCFALNCLFSSYWGFFGRTAAASRGLWSRRGPCSAVPEQLDTFRSSSSCRREEPQHPELLPTPTAQPRGVLAPVGSWSSPGKVS